jgi:hypothetical protein
MDKVIYFKQRNNNINNIINNKNSNINDNTEIYRLYYNNQYLYCYINKYKSKKTNETTKAIITFSDKKKTKKCLEILIDYNNTIANINEVINLKCMKNIQQNNKIESYFVEFLKIGLMFCLSKFSFIKKFELSDNSYITCKKFNKKKIYLSNFHFIKYGKTWYEDKLNATVSKKDTLKVSKIKKILNKYFNKRISIKNLTNFFEINKKNSNRKIILKIKKNLKEINGLTWKKFIRKIVKKNLDCYYYNKLLLFLFYKNTYNLKNKIKKEIGYNSNNLLEYNKWYILKNIVKKYDIEYQYEEL